MLYNAIGRHDGGPAAVIAVFQIPGTNALEVADKIKKTMDDLSTRFPRDMEYLISLDTTRADHLSCYGAPAGRTPHLDALAGEESWPEWSDRLQQVVGQWIAPEPDREAVLDVVADLAALGAIGVDLRFLADEAGHA